MTEPSVGLDARINELLKRHESNLKSGLTSEQVRERRSHQTNVVDPPVRCPAWICCLLPCLKSLPSRKAFAQIQPDDAQVKRNGKWMRYEASCLVVGDVIRLEAGDLVPADCIVIQVDRPDDTHKESLFLVDHSRVTGEERRAWRGASEMNAADYDVEADAGAAPSALMQTLYWGGQVIQGSAMALVVAIGSDTYVAKSIQQGTFPPKGMTRVASFQGIEPTMEQDEGISLIATTHA